ncbi:MAG: VCBS repeat-containing protein, partial [Planctomycetales bacterium]|nr:VCBS repeat-containing protein [Planctomycetales bacterium]
VNNTNYRFNFQPTPTSQYLADGALLQMPNEEPWGIYWWDKHGAVDPSFAYQDFDGDGKLDLAVGAAACCFHNDQKLRVFRGSDSLAVSANGGTNVPWQGATVALIGEDFDGDGWKDLVAASEQWAAQLPASCANAATIQTDGFCTLLPFNGAPPAGYGYSMGVGGNAEFFPNQCSDVIGNCSVTPFDGIGRKQITVSGVPPDYDFGVAMDYDNDPNKMPDFIGTDGNGNFPAFFVFANRPLDTYHECGTAQTIPIPVPGLIADPEMMVTDIVVNYSVPGDFDSAGGGWLNVYLDNQPPDFFGNHDWGRATACADSGLGTLCKHFDVPGRQLFMKIEVCSGGNHTVTPELDRIQLAVKFQRIPEVFSSGIVSSDGLIVMGSAKHATSEGAANSGHFYGMNAELDTCYFDVAEKLQVDTSRTLYTTYGGNNIPSGQREGSGALNLATTPLADLKDVFQAHSDFEMSNVLAWIQSPRFPEGDRNMVHGAVVHSTPAIIPPPGLPLWYVTADEYDRVAVDDFMASQSQRRTVIMYGSKDGFVHGVGASALALRDDIDSGSANCPGSGDGCCDPPSVQEMWAIMPPSIARAAVGDYNISSSFTTQISHFPDGAVTVVDVKDQNGAMTTVFSMGMGEGGHRVFTGKLRHLTGSPPAPDPNNIQYWDPHPMGLWSATAGADPEPGRALTKPVSARVRIDGAERFIMITASHRDEDDDDRGRRIAAFDTMTGEILWQYNALCAVTTDVVTFETDDKLDREWDNEEQGLTCDQYNGGVNDECSRIDGYMDRALFCDACGVCYKVPLNVDLNGGWNKSIPGDTTPCDPVQNGCTNDNDMKLGGRGVFFHTGALAAVSPHLLGGPDCDPTSVSCSLPFDGAEVNGNTLVGSEMGTLVGTHDLDITDECPQAPVKRPLRDPDTQQGICDYSPESMFATKVEAKEVNCTPTYSTTTKCTWWGCFTIVTQGPPVCDNVCLATEYTPAKDLMVDINGTQISWRELCYCEVCVDKSTQFCAEQCVDHSDAAYCGGPPPVDDSCPHLADWDRTPKTPIAGTVATRADTSGRMVAFFGTGGLADYSHANPNAFYATYVDNGQIRGRLDSRLRNGKWGKFYGGTLVTKVNILTSVSWDPDLCDDGHSELLAFGLDACDTSNGTKTCSDPNGDFDVHQCTCGSSEVGAETGCDLGFNLEAFTNGDLCPVQLGSSAVSSMYGDAGAVYIATADGTVTRIGEPRAHQVGDDTLNNTFVPFSLDLEQGFTLMGFSGL